MSRPRLLQGDVVDIDGEQHVILARSCDLPREKPEGVLVAPVVKSDSPIDSRGWNVRRVRVPALVGSFADMSRATTVAKSRLPVTPAVRGCRDEDQVRRFREDAGRFLSVSSLPDGVAATVDPLWSHMKDKRRSDGYQQMIDAIDDIRVRFRPGHSPDDEVSPRSMTLIFVADEAVVGELPDEPPALLQDFGEARDKWLAATTMAEKATALESYCHLLGERCHRHDPVIEIDVEVVTTGTFTYAEYFASDPIRVEAISAV